MLPFRIPYFTQGVFVGSFPVKGSTSAEEEEEIKMQLELAALILEQTGSPGSISENEKKLLIDVLTACNWNKSKTALKLEISRSTLYEKLKKYQIGKPLHIAS